MTDNEQIIIDSINVNECKHYERHSFYDCNETYEDNGAIVCTNCEDNPNCYFKQLVRKTQEYKELQEKLRKLELKNITLQNRNQQLDGSMVKADRYCKALEKIEEVIEFGYREYTICGEYNERCSILENILDIINKAKRRIK